MLVLSRKNRESVVIGADDGVHRLLKVTVLAIKGTNVKLGFEVDDDVPVHRSEVWDQINSNTHEPSYELEELTASYGDTVVGI